jgi:ATP-dependent Clp protease ATP-binding subunit ClpC
LKQIQLDLIGGKIYGRTISEKINKILKYSREEAVRLGNDYIGTEHILLGIIKDNSNLATKILQNLGVDIEKFHRK